MTTVTEAEVEAAARGWLAWAGRAHGPHNAPDPPGAWRLSFR